MPEKMYFNTDFLVCCNHLIKNRSLGKPLQHSHENSNGLKLKQTAQHAQMKGKNEHVKGKIFLSFLPPAKLKREMLCSLSMGETIQVTVWIRT